MTSYFYYDNSFNVTFSLKVPQAPPEGPWTSLKTDYLQAGQKREGALGKRREKEEEVQERPDNRGRRLACAAIRMQPADGIQRLSDQMLADAHTGLGSEEAEITTERKRPQQKIRNPTLFKNASVFLLLGLLVLRLSSGLWHYILSGLLVISWALQFVDFPWHCSSPSHLLAVSLGPQHAFPRLDSPSTYAFRAFSQRPSPYFFWSISLAFLHRLERLELYWNVLLSSPIFLKHSFLVHNRQTLDFRTHAEE